MNTLQAGYVQRKVIRTLSNFIDTFWIYSKTVCLDYYWDSCLYSLSTPRRLPIASGCTRIRALLAMFFLSFFFFFSFSFSKSRKHDAHHQSRVWSQPERAGMKRDHRMCHPGFFSLPLLYPTPLLHLAAEGQLASSRQRSNKLITCTKEESIRQTAKSSHNISRGRKKNSEHPVLSIWCSTDSLAVQAYSTSAEVEGIMYINLFVNAENMTVDGCLSVSRVHMPVIPMAMNPWFLLCP